MSLSELLRSQSTRKESTKAEKPNKHLLDLFSNTSKKRDTRPEQFLPINKKQKRKEKEEIHSQDNEDTSSDSEQEESENNEEIDNFEGSEDDQEEEEEEQEIKKPSKKEKKKTSEKTSPIKEKKEKKKEKKEKDTEEEGKDDQGEDDESGSSEEITPEEAIKERNRRTIFVGNLPNETTTKDLKQRFSKHGVIENIRFRSVAVASPKLPKKVAHITKQYSDKISDVHAYIVFKTKEEAKHALRENTKIFMDRHLRVDIAANEKGKLNNVNSVFVGNLPFDIADEALWQAFSSCGTVTAVRVVRDPQYRIGRGIGYVMFSSPLAIRHALQMDQTEIQGRKIRVSRVESAYKQQRKKLNTKTKSPTAIKAIKKNPTSFQGKQAIKGKAPRLAVPASQRKPRHKKKNANKKNK